MAISNSSLTAKSCACAYIEFLAGIFCWSVDSIHVCAGILVSCADGHTGLDRNFFIVLCSPHVVLHSTKNFCNKCMFFEALIPYIILGPCIKGAGVSSTQEFVCLPC
jgi:hypothetical protein